MRPRPTLHVLDYRATICHQAKRVTDWLFSGGCGRGLTVGYCACGFHFSHIGITRTCESSGRPRWNTPTSSHNTLMSKLRHCTRSKPPVLPFLVFVPVFALAAPARAHSPLPQPVPAPTNSSMKLSSAALGAPSALTIVYIIPRDTATLRKLTTMVQPALRPAARQSSNSASSPRPSACARSPSITSKLTCSRSVFMPRVRTPLFPL